MNIKELNLSDFVKELVKPQWNAPLMFVGDIGGTNARLGFARQGENDGFIIVTTRFRMKNKSVKDIDSFFKIILENVPATVIKRVTAGVINVPGPVLGGAVAGPFNNLKGGVTRLEDYPVALFPVGRSAILNDLEAGGFGLLAVSNAHVFPKYFELMWEGTLWKKCETRPVGSVLGCGRCLVLAPGTGLGSCLIHYDVVNRRHVVLPLEFGSQTLPVLNDLAYIEKRAAELKRPPNYEHLMSGGGLEYHYKEVVAGRKPPLSAAQIAKAAEEGDADAIKAMNLLYFYLMRVSSEASTVFLPLTVIVIGDNTVHNKFYLENHENMERMRREALNNPTESLGFQSRVTYLRQKKLLNFNLIGCYQCALEFCREKQTSKL